jgi:hypothetical protein
MSNKMKIKKLKLSREQENNMHFLSGFNDALTLIQLLDEFNSWEEAVKHFDWDDEERKFCPITQDNLEKVRKIWETKHKK